LVRILYQCSGFLPGSIGGVEVLSYHLVKELIHRGHEILVVANRDDCDPLGPQTFDGLDLVKLEFVPAMQTRNLSALRNLSEAVGALVRNFAPDILHLNDVWASSFLFLRGGATGNLPRVLTLHSPIRAAGKDGLQARLATDADRIVAVSQAHLDAAAAAMPALRSKMSVILNALPLPSLTPADLPFAPPILLGVGRLYWDKGFDLAVRAFTRVRQRGITARLTIAGNGWEKRNLECLARDLGVAGEAEFADWVAPDRVPSVINAATMVLMPSRMREPFGLVALQAAQMGRPTVASAVGGLPEIVEHGQTGLLFEPDDERAFADAIERLLTDDAMAKRLGENARWRAREKFVFPALVDAYERVYAQALQGPAPGGRAMVA
jgi:glycogen synthase